MEEIRKTRDRIHPILRDAGLRCTQGRVDVLNVLLNASDPLTHEDVYGQLARSGINRVTVYRVLESLQSAGIVHRVEAGDRVWRFAVCGKMHRGHCHPHFICRACGRIECLNEYPMPKIDKALTRHTIENQEIYLRGVCEKCCK